MLIANANQTEVRLVVDKETIDRLVELGHLMTASQCISAIRTRTRRMPSAQSGPGWL